MKILFVLGVSLKLVVDFTLYSMASYVKHILHCFLMLSVISCFFYKMLKNYSSYENFEVEYNYWFQYFLKSIKFLVLLSLPPLVFSFLGLLWYNTFPGKVSLKGSPLLAPFISFRVVTRGDYPALVKENVKSYVELCFDVGIESYIIEVVTDKPIHLPDHPRIREIVVPEDYRTKSGAKFKARALQYCLEESVSILNAYDWIVHLDEETVMTANSLRGILNFVSEGKYALGQGLITYAKRNVANWVTTLFDSFRVATDLGMLQFLLKVYHMPVFGWKGSFVVAQVKKKINVM